MLHSRTTCSKRAWWCLCFLTSDCWSCLQPPAHIPTEPPVWQEQTTEQCFQEHGTSDEVCSRAALQERTAEAASNYHVYENLPIMSRLIVCSDLIRHVWFLVLPQNDLIRGCAWLNFLTFSFTVYVKTELFKLYDSVGNTLSWFFYNLIEIQRTWSNTCYIFDSWREAMIDHISTMTDQWAVTNSATVSVSLFLGPRFSRVKKPFLQASAELKRVWKIQSVLKLQNRLDLLICSICDLHIDIKFVLTRTSKTGPSCQTVNFRAKINAQTKRKMHYR